MQLGTDFQQRRRTRGQRIDPVVDNTPRRLNTPVASNGSRLSNRTVALAGPLTLSYAAQ
jgi:hypothetical protein